MILTVLLMDLLLASDTSICTTVAFPPLGDSDQVVVLNYIDFPISLKGGVALLFIKQHVTTLFA